MQIDLDANMLRWALVVGSGDANAGVRLALKRAALCGPRFKPARNTAVQWMRQALAGGPVLAVDIQRMALAAGVSMASLSRAKKRAGVESYREGGVGGAGCWYWRMRG